MLNGFFVNPILALRWNDFATHIKRMADLGARKIIVQWTSGHGYSLYPSKIYDPTWGLPSNTDWIKQLLETAMDHQIDVWLGLDACYSTTEWHYDKPLQSLSRRCRTTASELADLYRNTGSLAGFYIPVDLDQPLKKTGVNFLDQVVSHCHQLGYPIACPASEPRPKLTGQHYEANQQDQEWRARVQRLRRTWRKSWQQAIDQSGLDILVICDLRGVGRESDLEADLDHFQNIRRWVSLPLYHQTQDLIPTSAETQIGFSYHHLDPLPTAEVVSRHSVRQDPARQGPVRQSTVRQDPDLLRQKADQVEWFLRRRCLVEGQVVSVLDTRFPVAAQQNQWQEDADWLTGLYVGAESLRYATTGETAAADYARQSWQAVHKLSNINGIPGIVARYWLPHIDGPLGRGRKRWHQNDDGVYWISDISRDQLSGHMFGLATYFDHVATAEERQIIQTDVEAITDLIIDNQMMAIDPDGQPCIHGNFWVSPLLALSFLKSAYHITRKERYQEKYLDLIDPHYFLGHALKDARVSANPFFQHYHQDSPLYHFLQYEDEPNLRQQVLRICDHLYADTHRHGNVYLMISHAVSHPESDSGQKAVAELHKFDIESLNVSRWEQEARELLKNGDLPRPIQISLAYILGERDSLPNRRGNYLPIEYRPPKEFGWNYYAGEEARRAAGQAGHHGIHIQYSGVDYLLAYWMARYHGLVC